mgnify:CR=1 FL=1
MNLIEILKSFDNTFFEKGETKLLSLINELYESIMKSCHCDSLKTACKLECVKDDENYLYKFEKGAPKLNLSACKNFAMCGYLFVIDCVATIVRVQMQRGFKEFLAERENNAGQFYCVKENDDSPDNFKTLFRLDNIMLMYSTIEKDKTDFFSITQFDRRAFARNFMLAFFAVCPRPERNDYLAYLDDCFYQPDEDVEPLKIEELEDAIIAKFKSENALGFLEEMELREVLYHNIDK